MCAKGIDYWKEALRFTARMVGNISLPLFKAKFKANMFMHTSHSYTCYSIYLAPPTLWIFVRGFINNISRCIRKVLTIGEWLCTIFIAADREHKFTPLAIRFLSLLPSYKICHWLCQKQHKVCAKGIDHGRVAPGFKGDPVEIISIPLCSFWRSQWQIL